MNYDIKLINNPEGSGRVELDRIEFLAKHIKSIAQKALLFELFGYSKVNLPRNLTKVLEIFLTQTQGKEDETLLTLDAEYFKDIPVQLNLFKEKQELKDLTPMALVIKSFSASLEEGTDKNLIDEPLLEEVLKFKNFFKSDEERIQLSNRNTIPSIEFSKKEIENVQSIKKSIPKPQRKVVKGIIDEMKFSREQVILTTSESKKIIVLVAKDMFSQLKEFFGKEISVTGRAFFKPGGNLSYLQLESFGESGQESEFFSKSPTQMSLNQQIALQLREGKKRNPIDLIFGKWPGKETEEEFEAMIKSLD